MSYTATTKEAYQLFHEGALAFAEMEHNGICVDIPYLDKAITQAEADIHQLTEELRQDQEVWPIWRRIFGVETKLGSKQQLGRVVFGEMGYKRNELAKKKKDRGHRGEHSEAAFVDVDLPFVRKYFEIEKLKKAKSTYLEGLRREAVDGFVHPFFNLHIVRTLRSSGSLPNFQNLPTRNAKIGKIIRTAIIPRGPDRQLVEVDFKGIEVSMAAIITGDKNLMKYVTDPKTDMHRDTACQLFFLTPDQVLKKGTRDVAKSYFVFAEFYGDYWKSCAAKLWDQINRRKLRVGPDEVNGEFIKKHLKKKGITGLGNGSDEFKPEKGTYEAHVKEIEEDFWGNRFAGYSEWKKKWWNDYQRTGEFRTPTGFLIKDIVYSRNQVTNNPIQGGAFHCDLLTIILAQKEIKKRKMDAYLVNQIHDSLIADVHQSVVPEYIQMIKHIVDVELPKTWPWISVPMIVEVEASPPGRSWFEKKEVKL